MERGDRDCGSSVCVGVGDGVGAGVCVCKGGGGEGGAGGGLRAAGSQLYLLRVLWDSQGPGA